MSRSRKKTPKGAITTACSEKDDKRLANRALRRKVRQGKLELRIREVSNVWAFNKDGKTRFDPKRFPKQMRK